MLFMQLSPMDQDLPDMMPLLNNAGHDHLQVCVTNVKQVGNVVFAPCTYISLLVLVSRLQRIASDV